MLQNLSTQQNEIKIEYNPDNDIKIPLKNLGNVIDFSGRPLFDNSTEATISPECDLNLETVNLIKGLQQAPYRRKFVSKQLYTGHMRIDLNQPMVENNWILLKGPARAGKDLVIKDIISYFLRDDIDNNKRVVYVTPNVANIKFRDKLSEEQKEKLTIITTENPLVNSADLYYMPRTGLVIAQTLRDNMCNVLLVFDHIIEYDINEKRIFQKAKQPFAPTNIYNEIMENSGDFGPKKGKMTSVLSFDTDTVNFNFEAAQLKLQVHLESIVDHIVNFEPNLKALKTAIPKLDMVEFTGFNCEYWQKPLVAAVRKDFEEFAKHTKQAYNQNQSKRELGIQEDPWENYLYHDSKFILPLLTHKESLTITQQILLFKFIQRPIGDDSDQYNGWNDWISQFAVDSEKLKKNLFNFANEYDDFENNQTIVDIIESHLNTEFDKSTFEKWRVLDKEVQIINEKIDRFLKMFYLHTKLHGGLRDTKLDYFK